MLTMVVAPAAVGAVDWEPPLPQPPPAANATDELPGAIVWTYLGVQDIVGQATADTTQHIASVLGGWSDELAGPFFAAINGVLAGIGGIVTALGPLIGMEALMDSVASIFTAIADMFTALLTA